MILRLKLVHKILLKTTKIVTNSSFIRQSIRKLEYQLPNNSTDTMNLLKLYYNKIKIKVIGQLKSKRDFLSVDKWTSIMNRRYANIVLQTENEQYNHGLVGLCDFLENAI